ncbi:MAG: STAS domain-containing protein [Gammaproteobacteria bacterium]
MKTALKNSASASINALNANSFSISGTLNFNTVPTLMKQAEGMLANCKNASVDFAAVDNANSAGLALLIEMLRFMRQRKASIRFSNVPEQIAIVARAYGIETALDSAEFSTQISA